METIIVGEVVNETTGEPIPNVNIHFRGTKIGTTSDESGAYALRVDMEGKAQLVFSAVGYYTQRFDIDPGTMAGLQVALRERTAVLTEVVVAPNENPALAILRQVRAHRKENDRTLHPENQFTVKREQTLYVSHIGRKHLQRALWKSLQAGMIAQEDSTFILPLYQETQTFRAQGKETIPANDKQSRSLILTSTDYSTLLGNEGHLNFYANSVPLMGHAFLSPLATSGNIYYRYYLMDEDEDAAPSPTVRISFRTRNAFYPTFNGEMEIDTTTFALRSIHAHVPAEVAVNYVNTLHLTQQLLPNGTIASEDISVILDFAIKSEKAGTVFPTLLLSTTLRNPSVTSLQGGPVSPIMTTPQAASEQENAFSTLDSLPLIRTAKWFATIATTGYIPTGTKVDIGHIQEILQVNQHEGVHFGLPFRTNERFSEIVSLEASVGYGIRDKSAKGMGRISVNLPSERKSILQVEYADRYVWSEVDDFGRLLRENSMGYGNFDFTAYAFEALHRDSLYVNTALRQRQAQIHWFKDWTPNFESHLFVRAGHQDGYTYQSLSAITRFSWGEKKYDGFFMRRYAYSHRYPVLFVGLETGHWATSGLYAHVRLMLSHHVQLGLGGTLEYALQTGAVFGRVPATLLWQANANQGFAFDPYRFTFLHGGELLADKYLALHTQWNGQGILFNLIPGVRWLHLRELVEGKLAYGYLSDPTLAQRNASDPLRSHRLYGEIGVGIGNILRVCDLYSVWGFTPTIGTPAAPLGVHWGIRFRIHLGL